MRRKATRPKRAVPGTACEPCRRRRRRRRPRPLIAGDGAQQPGHRARADEPAAARPRSARTRAAPTAALSERLDAWLGGRELDDGRLAAYLAELFRRGARGLERVDGGRRGAAAREARRAGRIRPARPPVACWPAFAAAARTGAAARLCRARPRTWRRSSRRWSDRVARAAGSSPPNARPSIASSPGCSSWPGCGARVARRRRRAGGRLLVAVRRGKTNPDGKTADVRYVKGDVARAIRMLRERRGAVAPTDRVVGLTAQAISERFAAAARAAGVEPRLTAHSGRVGLASELTARGASAHDVMRAPETGGRSAWWRTTRPGRAPSGGRRKVPVSAAGLDLNLGRGPRSWVPLPSADGDLRRRGRNPEAGRS